MVFPVAVRLLVFALYFVFVLLFVWVLDVTSVICLGEFANRLLDPIKLSVSQLRRILDERGIAYDDIYEKSELVNVVQRSGGWTVAASPPTHQGDDDSEEPLEIRSADQFQQDVTESDHVWMIFIIPKSSRAVVMETKWMALAKRLSRIGIQTGTVECARHRRLCIERNWRQPEMLMSLPASGRTYSNADGRMQKGGPSTTFRLNGFSYSLNSKAVLDWIDREIPLRQLESLSDYEQWRSRHASGRVKVLMLSQGKRAPLYFRVVAHQLANKMDFAFTSLVKDRQSWVYYLTGQQNLISTSDTVVIVTQEGVFRYGERASDIMTSAGLSLYLSFLQPDIKELIVLSVILVNQYVVIGQLITRQGLTVRNVWVTIQTLLVVTTLIVTFWLQVAAAMQWKAFKPVSDFAMASGRYLAHTDFIVWLRWLLLQVPNRWCVLGISYALYSFLAYVASRVFWRQVTPVTEVVTEQSVPELTVQPQVYDSDSSDNSQEPMFRVTINNWLHQQHFHPISRDVRDRQNSSSGIVVDHQLHALLEELATALPASIDDTDEEGRPTEYIKNLPTWKHSISAQLKFRPVNVLDCENCVICLADFHRGEYLCALPCGHMFHRACVVRWLEKRSELCPVCRQPASNLKCRLATE